MTDWHCHLLPGIDDGPATMAEAVEMARALSQAGYTAVHCTPHLVKGTFEADNATVRTTLALLQAELVRQRIELLLLPGREYYLDEFLMEYLEKPLALGNERFLLIEISDQMPAEFVKETCYRIKCSGYVPMIAHPERCRHFEFHAPHNKGLRELFNIFNSKPKTQKSDLNEPSLLGYLKGIGCLFQGNLGSFAGIYGERVRQSAANLNSLKMYTHFGTDLHSTKGLGMLSGINMGEFISSSKKPNDEPLLKSESDQASETVRQFLDSQ